MGRFVYIFVYNVCKSLIINVYCGERGEARPTDSCNAIKYQILDTRGYFPIVEIPQFHAISNKSPKIVYKSVYTLFLPFWGRVHWWNRVQTGVHELNRVHHQILSKRDMDFSFNSSTILMYGFIDL